jgi:vacuolar-type H+-ATPase subunit C/Vma6
MSETLYANAVIAVRGNKHLLTKAMMRTMINASGAAEAAKILVEAGYNDALITQDPERDDLIIADEREKTFRLFESLCADENILHCIRARYDYHNAKILYSANHGKIDITETLYPFALKSITGNIADGLKQAIKKLDAMGNPKAADVFFHIERALFIDTAESIKKIKVKNIREYFEAEIDFTNIRSFVKSRGTKSDPSEFFIEGGKLTARSLQSILSTDTSGIKQAFSGEYEPIMKSLIVGNSLEEAMSLYLVTLAEHGKDDIFSIGPLFFWFVMKNEEFKAVKTILMGKRFNFSKENIRDNLGGAYEKFK